MTAAIVDLDDLEQGATYRWSARVGTLLVDVDGEPILDGDGNQQIDVGRDFTGCTARSEIRHKKNAVAYLTAVTTEDTDGGITLDDDGNVTMVIPDELTDALVYPTGFWDLKVYLPSGEEDRLFQGACTISPAVTKDAEV